MLSYINISVEQSIPIVIRDVDVLFNALISIYLLVLTIPFTLIIFYEDILHVARIFASARHGLFQGGTGGAQRIWNIIISNSLILLLRNFWDV